MLYSRRRLPPCLCAFASHELFADTVGHARLRRAPSRLLFELWDSMLQIDTLFTHPNTTRRVRTSEVYKERKLCVASLVLHAYGI